MAFGHEVITFSGFKLPYAGVAPQVHSILRWLWSSEYFGGKLGFVGAKKPPSFSFFFFAQYNMPGPTLVSFTILCLFFMFFFFASGCSFVNAQLTNLNLLVRILCLSARVPSSSGVLKNLFSGWRHYLRLYRAAIWKLRRPFLAQWTAHLQWSIFATRMTMARYKYLRTRGPYVGEILLCHIHIPFV